MASEVEICNLSLSRLGDTATISSLDEASAQAQYCKTFYPFARDTLLEAHQWTFITRRIKPAQVEFPYSQWKYAYAAPAELLDVISVIPEGVTDDYANDLVIQNNVFGSVNTGQSIYNTQPFALETLDDGTYVILTNQENPVVRYTVRVTDTTKYSALFVEALSWLLASHLAGPLIKGDEGTKMSQTCYRAFEMALRRATAIDANNQKRTVTPSVSWMVNR